MENLIRNCITYMAIINQDTVKIRIHKDQIEYYENLGFWYGRTFAHKKKNTV